jgi:superoxide dismutase
VLDGSCNPCVSISGDISTEIALGPALKFNGGGHINHTIFWQNMSPNGGGEPSGICQVIAYLVTTFDILFLR